MKNKKGLSQVVTTLIIILLVLVAIGIIWGVVSNLLDKSKGTIESSTKCMDLDVKATKVVDNSDGSFDVTLTRTANGEDISGVKVVIYSNNSMFYPRLALYTNISVSNRKPLFLVLLN